MNKDRFLNSSASLHKRIQPIALLSYLRSSVFICGQFSASIVRKIVWSFATAWLLITSYCAGSVSLPLEGYCKPGHYFPIKVDGSEASSGVLLECDDGIPVRLDPTNRTALVPMLAMGRPTVLTWPGGRLSLRSPASNERLIGFVDSNSASVLSQVAPMFPGQRLLPIQLSATDPISGPGCAWETLDALVLPSGLFELIDDQKRSTLLAGGVSLIALGESPPDARWPWKKIGSVWVLATRLAGPTSELVDENIYLPILGWAPGWSGRVRAQVMGAATLLVLVIAGLMIKPNRVTYAAAVAVFLLSIGGILYWRHSLGDVDHSSGEIIVNTGDLQQHDSFVYERARMNTTQLVPWTGATHPLFASKRGLNRSHMQLWISDQGQMKFHYELSADTSIAFLRREVQPLPLPEISSINSSMMLSLAIQEYLPPGKKILGSLAGERSGVLIETSR